MKNMLLSLTLLLSFSTLHAYFDRTTFSEQGIVLHAWSFAYCPEHLISDPEGCSSWVIHERDGIKECVLERNTAFYLFPFLSIDTNLIERLSSDIDLLPKIRWFGCDHGTCYECGEHVRLSMSLSEDCLGAVNQYKCGCLDDFINDVDDEALVDDMIEKHWHFCGEPTVCPEYFDESFAHQNFDRLATQIAYSKENPRCRCFWSESQGRMQHIICMIFKDFWITFDEYWYPFNQKKGIGHYEGLKELLFADRKLGEHLCFCFSYADIEHSLNEFNPLVYNDFASTTKVTIDQYEEWKTQILKRAQIEYLALCKECYERHPHPRVAQEIKELSKLVDEQEERQDIEDQTTTCPISKQIFQSPLKAPKNL